MSSTRWGKGLPLPVDRCHLPTLRRAAPVPAFRGLPGQAKPFGREAGSGRSTLICSTRTRGFTAHSEPSSILTPASSQGLHLARGRWANIRVVPTGQAIDESVVEWVTCRPGKRTVSAQALESTRGGISRAPLAFQVGAGRGDCRYILIINKLLKLLDAQDYRDAGNAVLEYATSARDSLRIFSAPARS
jgi:hypothetical protein